MTDESHSDSPTDEGITADSLIAELRLIGSGPCAGCSQAICHHEALMSIAMGFKRTPRCQNCLSIALELNLTLLRSQVTAYIRRRECYRAAWEWAGETEGRYDLTWPACIFGTGTAPDTSAPADKTV